MDLRYTPAYDAFRTEVRSFLEADWPLSGAEAELPLGEQEALFRDRAIARGYPAFYLQHSNCFAIVASIRFSAMDPPC